MFLPLAVDFEINSGGTRDDPDDFSATVVLAGRKLSHKTLNETLTKLSARGDPSFAFELRIGPGKQLLGFVVRLKTLLI